MNQIGEGASETPRVGDSRLASIDTLRGTAALAVVVTHAFTQGPPPADAQWFRALRSVTGYGHLGVALFFVISGFCIHLRAARLAAVGGRTAQRVDFVSFWKRRMWRLYPPYFVVLCGSMALVLAALWVEPDAARLAIYPKPTLKWIASDFIAHAFMLHGLIPTFDFAGGNSPLWSLAREEYLYLLYFPLLVALRRRGPALTFFAVTILGMLTYAVGTHVLNLSGPALRTLSSSALVLWVQWYLGAVAVEIYYGLVKVPPILRSFLGAAMFAAVAIFVGDRFPIVDPLLWGLAFFCAVNASAALEKAGRWPRRKLKVLAFTGAISYSLYLVHSPALAVLGWVVRRFISTSDPAMYTVVAIGLGGGSYLIACLYFYLIERHFVTPRAHRQKVSTVVPELQT